VKTGLDASRSPRRRQTRLREKPFVEGKTVVETKTREQLEEKMDRGEDFVLVDTLGEEYYRHSHLPGAINLPLEEIDRSEAVLPDKEADISFSKHKPS
jgi:3-mercaptopyruvate sulfurtransferase SseA